MADADEAAREDVEEKPLKELRRRQGHRFQAVSSGVVPPSEVHLAGVHADQPVIGDRHAVGLPVADRCSGRGTRGPGSAWQPAAWLRREFSRTASTTQS